MPIFIMKKLLFPFFAVFSFLFVACSGQTSEEGKDENIPTGTLTLKADKTSMIADGKDAVTFTVTFQTGGETTDVTDKAEIYLTSQTKPMNSNMFSTDEEGEYVFYALYGLNMSDDVKVTSHSDIPELPSDPQPENTSFTHKMLLIQHTGTDCQNCPTMMNSLKALSEDAEYNQAYNHVASHSYAGKDSGDPGCSEDAIALSRIYCSGNYPEVTFNLTKNRVGTALSEIKEKIDQLRKESSDVGISASSIKTDDMIMVNVGVKTAASGDYRVGVWVMEDDIYAIQNGASEKWHNTHENVLRAMITNAGSLTSFPGEPLEGLKASTEDSDFFYIQTGEDWEVENCEFLIYVTKADAEGNYDVVNSIVCPVGEQVQFDYK